MRIVDENSLSEILDWDVMRSLDAAVGRLRGTDEGRARRALNRIKSALPPICSAPQLLETAREVLTADLAATSRFQDAIDHFDSWAAQRHPTRPLHPSLRNAETILVPWRDGKPLPVDHGRHDSGLASPEAIVTLTAAAAVAGVRDPAALVRNVNVIHEQLTMVDALTPLAREARRVLGNEPGGQERFVHALRSLDDGFPELPNFPRPGTPLPFPAPPPELPLPPSFPWQLPETGSFPDLCSAVTLQSLLRLITSGSSYQIDRITPSRACPGQLLSIEGRGFDGAGFNSVNVAFPSASSETPLLVEPDSRTDTVITVVVPVDAVCGTLTLNIDAALAIEVCGVNLSFSPPASRLVAFDGGATRILDFKMANGDAGAANCLHAGDVIEFSWKLCNTDHVGLRITIEAECLHPQPVEIELTPIARSYRYTVPRLSCNARLVAGLSVLGRCGRDEKMIFHLMQRPPVPSPRFIPAPFANWHSRLQIDLCDRPPVRGLIPTAYPANPDELVSAVAAIPPGNRLGVMGSGWSYTDCVAPARTGFMIDTTGMQRVLALPPIAGAPQSVLSERVLRRLRADSDVSSRLIHVEAGIKIYRLNCELECRDLAMPTLGGSNGQSIGGVLGTGTHGANPGMPPIADLVRAIHLIGPGGERWWIEPASAPITSLEGMNGAKDAGLFDPCLRVEYDDDLFRACLVACGSAGIIYSVVLETVPQHRLESRTRRLQWDEAKRLAQQRVIDPDEPQHWFFELCVNPTLECWLTTREPTDESPSAPTDQGPSLLIEILAFLFGSAVRVPGGVSTIVGLGTGAVATLVGALPFYIFKRSLLYAFYLATFQWGRLRELADEIRLLQNLASTIRSIVEVIATEGSNTAVARLLPRLLNVMWQVGFYVVSGRALADQLQALLTSVSRPEGTRIEKSYHAMTGQENCRITPGVQCEDQTYPDSDDSNSWYTELVHSSEYALPADRCLAFVDTLLALAISLRDSPRAFSMVLNIRFTRGTQAFLGMQQAERVGHVEVYTIDGLSGNREAHPIIETLARSARAVPHWGQFHSASADFDEYYPQLTAWRSALDRMAAVAGASANVFRHEFARSRGLLSDV